jgi:acetyl-CoA synthetase
MPAPKTAQPPRPIHKVERGAVPPNMGDYAAERAAFSWASARAALDGLPGGALNIAHEAVDRHAAGARRDHVALRWLGRRGERRDVTYAELAELTSRFAGALDALGVRRGERVFALAGRVPELYVAALGTLKHGSVFCPLFSAFGPEPVRQRLRLGDGRVLVTTAELYERKVAGLRADLPGLEHVLLVDADADGAGTRSLTAAMAAAPSTFPTALTAPGDVALLHFTSGTTGRPKGALHVHEAVVAHHATGRIALDLHAEDVFWCTADPGWVTGTSYGIVSPLTHGVTLIVDEDELDRERWYRILAEERVSVWYTAPTAIRMLMRGASPGREFSDLRFVASVGEPLHPDGVLWGCEALGLPIHDNWWQTETGGIMIANYRSMDVKPGSMGRPLPGVEAVVVRSLAEDEDGRPVHVEVIDEPDVEGELALRPGWPSMFRGYLGEEARYRRCFVDGWYLTGDLVRRDDDGYFWFVARGDDVIKSAGHLIGPFEVESILLAHPAVAEAGVIGIPDAMAGEVVKAVVTLRSGYEPSDALRRELLAFARTRLGPVVAPKQLGFADVPRNKSGKVMRRLLRARELGLPEGDVSTLERSA